MRYEELTAQPGRLDTDAAENYFRELLLACGIADLPGDWRDRVTIGADRRQSGTARENLSQIALAVPAELPPMQRRHVDLTAPGLCEILRYH